MYFDNKLWDAVEFDALEGHTFTEVDCNPADSGNDDFIIFKNDETQFLMKHDQQCCESVHIEDIAGDLTDLVGAPILSATETDNKAGPLDTDHTPESYTWTFYNIRTVKGAVNIRWYGTSNGYYSESVGLYQLSK